jgi:hypothetical protein
MTIKGLLYICISVMVAAGCDDDPGRNPGVDSSVSETAPPADSAVGSDLDIGVKLDAGTQPGDGPVTTVDNGTPKPDQQATGDSSTPSTIWKPKPGTTWQWQLSGTLDTTVNAQMYDIDLFDNSAAVIAGLQAQGRVVICYFSAGSYEDWRPDAQDFPQAVLGSKMSGWDELWLDIRAQAVRTIMQKRLDLAKSKGCDGVEPDNVDGYSNKTGFPLSAQDQITYNMFLAAEAHKRGLSIGLKNDVDQVKTLEPFFDWALNEECLSYNECNTLAPFINAGKAVFHTEYTPATKAQVCPQTKPLQFSTLIKKLDLDAWFEACWN